MQFLFVSSEKMGPGRRGEDATGRKCVMGIVSGISFHNNCVGKPLLLGIR